MNEKDHTGNKLAVFTTMGARNCALEEREENDFYATDPKALELLLEKERFSPNVWECACGKGHLSEVLKNHGYNVKSTDLIDRGYGDGTVDFLKYDGKFDGDIITNPPYKYALEFVKKAVDTVTDGHKVAMFLKIQFLESKERRSFFDTTPPRKVYISSSRLCCAMNGDFGKYQKSNAMMFTWQIWEKGYDGKPEVEWFN
jgi:hypothetical protein